MSHKAVLGLVTSYERAEAIAAELRRAGFANADISVLFPNNGGTRAFAYENNTKAPEGTAVGAGVGGAIGGTIGLLVGIGALAIPGLGPVIAAGPLMAALSGAGLGGALGGITGALVGMGIPELEAKIYEGKVKAGGILISIHTQDATARTRARAVLELGGATDIVTFNEIAAGSPAHASNRPRPVL